MSSSRRVSPRPVVAAVLLITLTPMAVAIGQSSVAVSPFVSYVPSAATNPLAGMALTFGGTTGLALRASADMSIATPDKSASTTGEVAGSNSVRPWGADADAILFLGGLGGGATVFSRALSPYVFSGIGLTGRDSAGTNVVRNGWSYGAGAAIPLGFDADLFGEARWRMSQYVLPTSKGAPSSTSEMRFGLSFHVGGGGSREPAPIPRRGRRMDSRDDVVYVEPAPASVPATATATAINVSVPESVVESSVEDARPAQAERRSSSATTSRVMTARRASGIVYRTREASSASTQSSSSRTMGSTRSTRSTTTSRTQSSTSTACRSGRVMGSTASASRARTGSCTTARRSVGRATVRR